MKKTIASLLTAIILVANIMCSGVFASGFLTPGDEIGAEQMSSSREGHFVLQNEKYLFVVENGAPIADLSNPDIHMDDKIHIYEKPNEEHFDFKYLTTYGLPSARQLSGNMPIGGIGLTDDVLVISYATGLYSKTSSTYDAVGARISPTYAYDVREIVEGENFDDEKKIVIDGATTEARNTKNQPFIRGYNGFYDEQEGRYYYSSANNLTTTARTYHYVDTADLATFFATGEGTNGSVRSFKKTGSISKNAVKFIIKDGYLFEILQAYNGLPTCPGDGTTAGSGVNTLVDDEGDPMNNSVFIFDLKKAEEDEVESLEGYKKATYTTETAGNFAIQEIAVRGDYVYLGTTDGVEIIDFGESKTAEEAVPLARSAKLLAGSLIKSLKVIGEKLYVGTNAAMYIYDVSSGIPVELVSYEYVGGFNDFSFDEVNNDVYALSAQAKGVVVISLDDIDSAIDVTSFTFSNEEALVNGENTFVANVINETAAEKEFKSVYTLYKDGKLMLTSVKEWSVSAGESLAVTDTFNIEDESGCYAKVMFTAIDDETKVLPLVTDKGVIFEKEIGGAVSSVEADSSSFNISEVDESGKVVISGTVSGYNNKPVAITVKNSSATEEDRLGKLRYFDVVTVDENGKYALEFTPQDSGTYEVEISKVLSHGKASKTFEVSEAQIKVANGIEIPGVNAFLFISVVNGQNIDELNVSLSFDENILEAKENIELSEDFEVKSVTTGSGSVDITFKKKNAITTAENEFCLVPIEIKQDAVIGDYNIEITATAKNEFGDAVSVVSQNGILTLEAESEKYDAIKNAVAALSAVKKADEIAVDDYHDQKSKAEAARTKSDYAINTFAVRESQLGKELLVNLTNAEARLLEIKPYYDAVDEVNAAESEAVVEKIKEKNEFFEIDAEAFVVYDNLEDKTELNNKLASINFVKPAEVNSSFKENLVLEAFASTRWSGVDQLLKFAQDANKLDISAYNSLTEEQKAEAQKILALRDYQSMTDISNALSSAVASAKNYQAQNQSPQGGSASGSGSRNSDRTVYANSNPIAFTPQPTIKTQEPEGFSDISQFGWAKDAIDFLYKEGVINGKQEGIFAPADNVKREEFAKMVALAFDITSEEHNHSFSDVAEAAWYIEYICALAENGIVNGRPDGTFGVGDYITREEIAVILDRVASIKGIELAPTVDAEISDKDDISEYAAGAVEKMFKAGIISGFDDGTIKARENANRAQTAQLIYKILTLA